jgi:hypothetical protein
MNFRWVKRIFAGFSLLALILASHTQLSKAQTATYQITPARTTITASPGDTKIVTIKLVSTANKAQDFKVTFENFTSDGETGAPKLLPG